MSALSTNRGVPRRAWGKTGISVPVIAFGTQGFGNYFGAVSDHDAIALIARAIALGVNHFDCSLCYGDSVRKLALALRDIPRTDVIISGRICLHERRSSAQSELTPRASASDVVRDVERQLSVVGIDYFDAVLVHDPPALKPTLRAGGVLDGLIQCRDRGLTRWIGFGMEPAEWHGDVLRTQAVDVLLHFNDYHLLRRSAAQPGGVLELASEHGIGVMTGWSILRGLLTDAPLTEAIRRGGLDDPADLAAAGELREWARDNQVSLLAVALQFCLRDPRIHTLPIGHQNVVELERNIQAVADPIADEIWQSLDEWYRRYSTGHRALDRAT